MFEIDPTTNSIKALARKSFSELGFTERKHLQEWLAGNPIALGEKLLIIQKEFSGFAETSERLDLLALDCKGNLVIIENKLDDSGRDVTWQALKYASYCSTLTKDEIRNIFQSYLDAEATGKNAVEELEEFFDGKAYTDLKLNQGLTQRIFLVAANFRKEVTSTALWLRNFKIQLHCFKATTFTQENEKAFLLIEQIIPVKDAQEYIISMTNKAQEDISNEEELQNRHKVRIEFWTELLKQIKGKSTLFQNSNPTKDHWLVAGGTNIAGLSYQLIITMNFAVVQLNFGRSSTEENKLLYDALKTNETNIEKTFGDRLNWERLNDKKSCRISFALPGVNYFLKEDWQRIIEFLIAHINKLEASTKPFLGQIKKLLSAGDSEQL